MNKKLGGNGVYEHTVSGYSLSEQVSKVPGTKWVTSYPQSRAKRNKFMNSGLLAYTQFNFSTLIHSSASLLREWFHSPWSDGLSLPAAINIRQYSADMPTDQPSVDNAIVRRSHLILSFVTANHQMPSLVSILFIGRVMLSSVVCGNHNAIYLSVTLNGIPNHLN